MSAPQPPPQPAPPPAQPPGTLPPGLPKAPPAPPQTVPRSLAVVVPESAKVGDRLSFHTPAGAFTLTVPPGAMPGKSMNVSLPIPVNFPMNQQLQLTNIRLNGEPIPPKIPPELLALTNEHKARVDSHWGRFHNSERVRVRTLVELTPLKPSAKVTTESRLGFWKVPRTVFRVDDATNWERGVLPMKTENFRFGGADFAMIVQARALPWRTSAAGGGVEEGNDAELQVVLRRGPAEVPALPLVLFCTLEISDRWSAWQRVSLSGGEEFVYDLGDRRRIADLFKFLDSAIEVTLSMTASAPGSLAKQQSESVQSRQQALGQGAAPSPSLHAGGHPAHSGGHSGGHALGGSHGGGIPQPGMPQHLPPPLPPPPQQQQQHLAQLAAQQAAATKDAASQQLAHAPPFLMQQQPTGAQPPPTLAPTMAHLGLNQEYGHMPTVCPPP